MSCDECRRLLADESDNSSLARKLEAEAPMCACEGISLSDASPGPVENNEVLYRIMVSPRDYDPLTKLIAQKPFEKLFSNGLSVMREKGSDKDFIDIVEDGLVSKPQADYRSVKELCQSVAVEIRNLKGDGGSQAFCVYDQIVPRNIPGAEPVPTHAGVFQREIKFDVDGAKKANRDMAFRVFELFSANRIGVQNFRENLFEQVNAKAEDGGYVSE